MSTQHSPGPWEIDGNLIRNTEGQIVAEVQEFHHFEIQLQNGTLDIDQEDMPWQGNAELIAAAPELLDTLREMYTGLVMEGVAYHRAMLKAKALIAKLPTNKNTE
jgi:hypothetical protein